ncbi:hypothetical protein [Streptomyces sp. NPDC005125]
MSEVSQNFEATREGIAIMRTCVQEGRAIVAAARVAFDDVGMWGLVASKLDGVAEAWATQVDAELTRLAEFAGVAEREVARQEQAEYERRRSIVGDLADALGIKRDDLLPPLIA